MLDESTLKQDMYEMIMEAEGQLRDTPVSAESTLYLCDAVVWGKMNYYTFLGALTEREMKRLEKPIRHRLLKAAKLPKSLSHTVLNLPAGLCGIGWMSWYDRLMKNRVATINKWIGTDTAVGFVLRWALEKLQNRVATPVPVGCSGEVSQYVS